MKKVIVTFPDETRLGVFCELIEENQLPIQNLEQGHFVLNFCFAENDRRWVYDFLIHAQTINLASSYWTVA